jgi:hypothetical protein
MTIEDQLHDTFSTAVAGLDCPDRWEEVVRRGRRRRRNRRIGIAGSAALALAAVVGMALSLTGGPATRQVKIAPAQGSQTPTTPITTTPVPAQPAPAPPPATAGVTTPTGAAPPAPDRAKAASPTTLRPAPYRFGYVPLFPFTSQAQADDWLAAYRGGGVQPWHADAPATALAFAGFLGFQDINQVTASNVTSTDARVSVGFLIAPSRPHTAAVVHLVRFGSSPDAPWEVVGTDDQPTFTITSPAYGATVRSALVAGGRITGVDESITVEVRSASSSAPLGRTCCQPAGGTHSPWAVAVPFRGAAAGQVLVVSATTGGHVAAVERFVVTGVRA